MKRLSFRVDNPGYSNYHRAAVGGLAASMYAFYLMPDIAPVGLRCSFDNEEVVIEYPDEMPRTEVFRRMLAASFRVDENGLIDMPGQAFGTDNLALRLAIHNGIIKSTFCQHNCTFKKKQKTAMLLTLGSDDKKVQLGYIGVNWYAHQDGQGTDLLEPPKKKRGKNKAPVPERKTAYIRQHIIPGAVSGARMIEAPVEEVFLLHYVMVGCPVFYIPPRKTRAEKVAAQYCVIIPDIVDLVAFAKSAHRLATMKKGQGVSVDALINRISAGAAEAALKFNMMLTGSDYENVRCAGVVGCSAVAMGRVAWDPQQNLRVDSFSVRTSYPELEVFRAAHHHLGRGKIITTKLGGNMELANSLVPELVASNLINGRHWLHGFDQLIPDQESFNALAVFQRKGLSAMKNLVENATDRLIIEVVQAAWSQHMGKLGERSRRERASFNSLVENRREEIRNELNQTRTPEGMITWFNRFLSEASNLPVVKQNAVAVQEFIFNRKNFTRLKNLCIFAFVSYSRPERPNGANANGNAEPDAEERGHVTESAATEPLLV